MDSENWLAFFSRLASRGRSFVFFERLAVCTLALGMVVPVYADSGLPVSKDISLVVVADDMTINGISVSTYELTSKLSVSELVAFYSKAWDGDLTKSEMPLDSGKVPTTILAHRDGDNLITIQVKDVEGGGTHGYVGISNAFSSTNKRVASDLPLPGGSTLVNDIVAHDPGKTSHTWVIQNKNSADYNLDFYRSYFADHGWSEVALQSSPTHTDAAPLPPVLMLNKGRDELNLAVGGSAGESTVVIVKVEN